MRGFRGEGQLLGCADVGEALANFDEPWQLADFGQITTARMTQIMLTRRKQPLLAGCDARDIEGVADLRIGGDIYRTANSPASELACRSNFEKARERPDTVPNATF